MSAGDLAARTGPWWEGRAGWEAFQSQMGNRGVWVYKRVDCRAETHAQGPPGPPSSHSCGGLVGRWQRWHPRKQQLRGDAEVIYEGERVKKTLAWHRGALLGQGDFEDWEK